MKRAEIGMIGNGSWATALVKILTDNGQKVNWWIRNSRSVEQIRTRRHNPHYLPSAYFDVSMLQLSDDVKKVVADSELLVMAVPSAYIQNAMEPLDRGMLKEKRILSAIKGLIPG